MYVLIIPTTLVCLPFSFSSYILLYLLLFSFRDLRGDLNDVDDINMNFVVIG